MPEPWQPFIPITNGCFVLFWCSAICSAIGAYRVFIVFLTILLFAGCQRDVGDDSTASEMAALAETKLQEGDSERALELFTSALEAEGSNPDAPLWDVGRAESLFDLGRNEEALTIVSRYINSANQIAKARAFLLKACI